MSILPTPAYVSPPSPPSTRSVHAKRVEDLLADDFWNTDLQIDRRLANAHNPLVSASADLLSLIARLRQRKKAPDLEQLSQRMNKALRRFTRHTLRAGLARVEVGNARYVLCVTADEAIMKTPWGRNEWPNYTLSSTFHGDTLGGEKFFQHLEQCLVHPQKHLWQLELMYLCLVVGFEGRYARPNGNPALLQKLHQQLYEVIVRWRGAPSHRVSPVYLATPQRPRRSVLIIPSWLLATVTALSLTCFYGVYSYALSERRQQVLRHFTPSEAVTTLAAHDEAPRK